MASKEQQDSSEGSLGQASHEQEAEVANLNLHHEQPITYKGLQSLLSQLVINIKKDSAENMKRLEQKIDDSAENMKRLEQKIDDSTQTIQKLERKVDEKYDELNNKFDGLKQKVDDINDKVDRLSQKVSFIQTHNERRQNLEQHRFQQIQMNFEEQKNSLEQGFQSVKHQIQFLHFCVDSKGNTLTFTFEQKLSQVLKHIDRLRQGSQRLYNILTREIPQSDRNYGRELTNARQAIQELQLQLKVGKAQIQRLNQRLALLDSKQKPESKAQK